MPNRGTNQDQQQTGRLNPTQIKPDDDEEETGDVSQMEEAGNLRRPGTQEAASVEEADVDEDEVDTDEDEDEDEDDADDEEPIGGRV